jgi:hypothetical protein
VVGGREGGSQHGMEDLGLLRMNTI